MALKSRTVNAYENYRLKFTFLFPYYQPAQLGAKSLGEGPVESILKESY